MDRRLDRICKRLWSSKVDESATGKVEPDDDKLEPESKKKKPDFSIDFLLSDVPTQKVSLEFGSCVVILILERVSVAWK